MILKEFVYNDYSLKLFSTGEIFLQPDNFFASDYIDIADVPILNELQKDLLEYYVEWLKCPSQILEFDMLIEMEVYMNELIEEHTREVNALVKIRQHLKKAERIVELEDVKKRIETVKGYDNKAHNFILFIKDYIKIAYGKEE